MTKYVVGLAFDDEGRVALIEKNRPAWQRGLLNGIGGKIEGDEMPVETMIREADRKLASVPDNELPGLDHLFLQDSRGLHSPR
jgi:hypothetical protein